MIGLVLLAAGNSERFVNSALSLINNNPNYRDFLGSDFWENFEYMLKMNVPINKVFLKINDVYVWEYSASLFSKFRDKISDVVFVLNKNTFDFHKKIIEEKVDIYGFKSIDFVEGGEKRQDSVFNGIKMLKDKYIDYIIVHDLARPNINLQDLENLIKTIEDYDGLTLYSLPFDSVAANYDNKITYLPRSQIYLIKTPQIFKKRALINAHEELREENLDMEFTDDISLLDFYLFNTGFIQGDPYNLKITTIQDLIILEKIVKIIK